MFYLKRSAVEPHEELQKKVFPQVDECIDKLNSGVLKENIAAQRFFTGLRNYKNYLPSRLCCHHEGFPESSCIQPSHFPGPFIFVFQNVNDIE